MAASNAPFAGAAKPRSLTFMCQCSCSQTRNARSVGKTLYAATGETAHMPHLRRIRLIVLMELHDPCVQSTSYCPKDRIADGIWSRLPEQMCHALRGAREQR